MMQWSSGRRTRTAAAVLAGAMLAAPGVLADDDEWTVKWSNGFKVESADKKFKLKFGGRVQADWSFADADPGIESAVGSVSDGNEFRRARLFVSGTVYERVDFKVQYDFAGGDAEFKDVYVGFNNTPVGNIRFGHFKEPFSLEELTSSKYIAFLERSLNNVFAPGRNTGVMFSDSVGDRLTWAAGWFREADDFGVTDDGEGKANLTARVTGLPIYQDKGKRLLHLGLSLSEKDLGNDNWRWRQRPESHLSPRFVNTGSFGSEGASLYNAELAGVFNRFWFAAEHSMVDMDNAVALDDGTGGVQTNCSFACLPGDPLGDPSFSGTYVQAGFFLTDDYRRYKTSSGAFDRQKPGRGLGDGGSGAWEIVLRYSMLDLTDEGIAGGELDNLGLGVNWYPNPVTRVMLDWVNADRDDIMDGGADFLLLRLQVDF